MIGLRNVATLALLAGCGTDAAVAESITLRVSVSSAPRSPLAGVEVLVDGELAGRTGQHGKLTLEVSGRAGRVVRVSHRCPPGYREASPPKSLRVRRYQGESDGSPMLVQLRCLPAERYALFAIRAKNAPDVPVTLNGQVVGRTNRFGIAHLWASARPGTEFTVGIDARGLPRLLPRETNHPFLLRDADEVFIVDQVFEPRKTVRNPRRTHRRIIKIE